MIDTKKIAAFFVGALLLFAAAVSGSIYPAALMTFTVAIVIVFLITLSDPERAGLLRLWPAWLLLLVTYASAFWTVNLNSTLMLAFAMSAYIVFASVASYAAVGERKRAILTVVFIAAVLVSGYGVYQYYIGFAHTEAFLRQVGATSGLTPDEIARAMGKLEYRRAFSTLLSPNVMACYLAMVFPVGISLFMLASKGKAKILFGAGLALILYALTLTKSVGGVLAFMVGLLIFVMLKPRVERKARVSKGVMALSLIALLVLLGGLWVMKARAGGFLGFEKSYVERLNFWHGAKEVFAGSPLTGTGAGTFGIMYSRYIPKGMVESQYAHNVFLQAMSETGIAGLVALLVILASFFLRSKKCIREEQPALTAGIMGGGAAFLAHNLVDFTWYVPETAILFWLYFGLASAGAGDGEPVRPAGKPVRVIAVVMVLIFGIFYTKSLIAESRQSGALFALAQKGITNASLARTNPPPPEAVKLAEGAVSLKPYDDGLHAFLAGLFEGLSSSEGPQYIGKAESEYREAIRLNPYYPFHYRDLGILYMRLGQKDKARDCFRNALSRYPSDTTLRKYLEMSGN